MSPPFAGTDKIDPQISPMVQRQGSASGPIEVFISTNGGQGILCFGGIEIFPILDQIGYPQRARLLWGIRQPGQADIINTWHTIGPDVAPPFYVAGAQWLSSDLDAQGGINHNDTDINQCMSVENSGRFTINAGVTATRTARYLYRVAESQNPLVEPVCPQGATVFEDELHIIAHFAP